jgi:hypothetical protein
MAHLDVMDLDWEEVTERSILDQRRGLVITQVAVLEELIDEFILYIVDPEDPVEYQNDLDRKTIGPRLNDLERELGIRDLLDSRGAELIADFVPLLSSEMSWLTASFTAPCGMSFPLKNSPPEILSLNG